MSSITCTSCGHALPLSHSLSDFLFFVCPKCRSLHEISGDRLIFNKKLTNTDVTYPLDINIGDTFTHHSKSYTIVNVSKKMSVAEIWWEFGGVNASGQWLFYSIMENFSRQIYSLNEFDLPKTFKVTHSASKGINKFGKHFSYDYLYGGISSYSAGLFQYDVQKKVMYYPFNCDLEGDNSFLSIETQGNDVYGYYGVPISTYDLYNKFDKNKVTINENYQSHFNNFYKLFAYILLGFALLFTLINFNGIFQSNNVGFASGSEDKANTLLYNQMKIPLDLTGLNFSQLTMEGSINSTTHNRLRIKLVNIQSKKIVYSNMIELNYNYVNNASAVNALIKNTDPGRYDLIVSATERGTTGVGFNANIDMKFTTGQIISYYPILFTLIFLAILFFVMHSRLDQKFNPNKKLKSADYLFLDGYIYIVSLCLITTFYLSYEVYKNYLRGTSVERMEDSNYIGQTNHYVYRTYSSHK